MKIVISRKGLAFLRIEKAVRGWEGFMNMCFLQILVISIIKYISIE